MIKLIYGMNEIYNKIKQVCPAEANVPMDQYCSFRAGGKADILASPENIDQLSDVLRVVSETGAPSYIMGNGSNILVKDGGYRGVIIKIGKPFADIKTDGAKIFAGGGAMLSAVAREAMKASLTGLEFASGIPGSLGGGVYMNAGAYGGEIKDVLERVTTISRDGKKIIDLPAELLLLSYRHSRLMETGDIVLSAVISLKKGDSEKIKEEMAELAAKRNSKQPVNYPSAGSFFKRPEGYFAGKLIQDAGLKGLSVGGAQVSELHSGFIINTGGATASDIVSLMHLVQARVMDRFGVMMEPEVRIIGEDPEEEK